jgi:predicted enzyme related to lactoylglutathione lyase
VPEGDMGVHPTQGARGNPPSGTHAVSFYCDHIEQTVAELRDKGVEFAEPIKDVGFGLVTHFKVPGGFKIQLYQARYNK